MPVRRAPRLYTDALAYRPGERVSVHADAGTPTAGRTRLHDLIGDRVVAELGDRPLRPQRSCVGSFAVVDGLTAIDLDRARVWTCWCLPTRPDGAEQGLLSHWDEAGHGQSLAIVDGRVRARCGDGVVRFEVTTERCLTAGEWYRIWLQRDGDVLRVGCRAERTGVVVEAERRGVSVAWGGPSTPLLLGALASRAVSRPDGRGVPDAAFDGKLQRPALRRDLPPGSTMPCPGEGDPGVVASWRLGPEAVADGDAVTTLTAVNLPLPCVTGVTWTGRTLSWTEAPEQYEAWHFRSDAVHDVGWDETASVVLPEDLGSGVYGIEVTTAEGRDTTPLIVTAPRPANPTAVLMSTFTYLAYANEQMMLHDPPEGTGGDYVDPRDRDRVGRPEYGLSQYDRHRDGSGSALSSVRRPIVTARHDYRSWLHGGPRGLAQDLGLLRWMAVNELPFDVIDDLQLHRRGAALLAGYRCVVTGSHPEYVSREILEAVETYRDQGGNLVYLGGNGFYQVTGVLSARPLVTEVRRGVAGVRAWESPPGEGHLASTGEAGGLWRHRGRAPQRLTGVGFCAQGWGRAAPYVRTDDSDRPEAAWVFAGVRSRRFGARGAVLGGAAGDELDRADVLLGTDPGALVLARATDLGPGYTRAIEEVLQVEPGGHEAPADPHVRADMVLTVGCRGRGSTFSVGSIAWTGSLLGPDRDQDVEAITRNVLARFSGPAVGR